MTARHLELRRGVYRDSVRLMQVSAAVSAVPGVSGALVAMATGLNLELLAGMGFTPPAEASPDDLVVAVAAADDDTVGTALARLESALSDPPAAAAGFGAAPPPRTVGAAVRRGRATLALVSTPGRYAFLEASDALDEGASVLVFSDNVPVAQEVALKERAAGLGLLVMGPDCGTAVVGGVGIGFANVVRPGPVGLVAASGTGAQQVMALLDAAGVGVSHCLGVGGRDLSADVGGSSTLAALAALDADPATDVVLLVSKPPAPAVAERVGSRAAGLGTPVVSALLGPGRPDLSAAVRTALAALGREAPRSWPRWVPDAQPAPAGGALRGLFAGGTLCDEAMILAAAELGRVDSNIPLRPEWRLPADLGADGHAMIDFGDDALTAGRPHPMIDPTLRLDRLAAEAADPRCRVLLLDVVLGHGAHPDPAADLAPAVAAGCGRDVPLDVVVSLTGTDGDPQGLARQAETLHAAGARVYRSNAEAARAAVAIARGRS